MDAASTLARAALENARWCDLVCRAHGAPGELHHAYWVDWHPVPPYHPRLVTLAGPASSEVHAAAVRALVASLPGQSFAVKDSFRALDLAPLGLQLLFEAEWIAWTRGDAPLDPGTASDLSLARDAGALARWEAAWRGVPGPAALAGVRVFPPAMLEHPGVDFVACERDAEIVAGFVLHASDGVVGLSNVSGDEGAAFAAAVTIAQERYPGASLVGYEHGASLDAALAAGFTRLGPLAVWERSAR